MQQIFTFIFLTDKLGLKSTDEREQILSKLYEIQHPSGPSVVDILKDPNPRTHNSHAKSLHQQRSQPHSDQGQVQGHLVRPSQDNISQSLHIWHDLSGLFFVFMFRSD